MKDGDLQIDDWAGCKASGVLPPFALFGVLLLFLTALLVWLSTCPRGPAKCDVTSTPSWRRYAM